MNHTQMQAMITRDDAFVAAHPSSDRSPENRHARSDWARGLTADERMAYQVIDAHRPQMQQWEAGQDRHPIPDDGTPIPSPALDELLAETAHIWRPPQG